MDNDDSFIEEVDRELLEQDLQVSAAQPREDDYRIGSHIRDNIANEMWQHYKQLILCNKFYFEFFLLYLALTLITIFRWIAVKMLLQFHQAI